MCTKRSVVRIGVYGMNNDIIIRNGEEKDAEVIAEFNVAMAMETEEKQLDGQRVLSGVRNLLKCSEEGFYVVAELNGEIIASLMVTKEWSDWRDGVFWWVQSVYVTAEQRKRGVFRRLYEFVKETAVANGRVCGLRLYVERDNTAAQKTYASLGMEETPYKMYEVMFWQ